MLAGLVDSKMKQEFVVRDKMLQQLSGLMKNIQGQIRREKVARDAEDEEEDRTGLTKRTVGPLYSSRAERLAANARVSTKATATKPEPPRRDEDGKVQPDRDLPRVAQTSKVEVRKLRAKKEKRAAKVIHVVSCSPSTLSLCAAFTLFLPAISHPFVAPPLSTSPPPPPPPPPPPRLHANRSQKLV